MNHTGGCHCGNITVTFSSTRDPADIAVRACQCKFCRKHNTLSIADPNGMLSIRINAATALNRYRFGYRTADYLICRTCGVYVAAITLDDTIQRAILMANTLEDHALFSRQPEPMTYEAETREQRLKRRAEKWMPVSLHLG